MSIHWYIQIAYGIPSLIFYIVVIKIVSEKRKHFSLPFLRLFYALAVILTPDCKLYQFLISIEPTHLLAVVLFTVHYCFYCQGIITFHFVLLTMRSVLFPFSSPIWETSSSVWACTTFLPPLVFTVGILAKKSFYGFGFDGVGLTIRFPKSAQANQLHYFIAASIFEMIINAISLTINIITISVLCRRQIPVHCRKERPLFFLTLAHFIVQVLRSSTEFTIILAPDHSRIQMAAITVLQYFIDFVCLQPPYAFLMLNSVVRKSICMKIRCREKKFDALPSSL